MAGKILGLDISDDSVTAVQVRAALKGYDITGCARISINGDGGLDQALEELHGQVNLSNDVCISSIPGRCVSFRNIRMPFSDVKKIRQTLPFEMETEVPFSISDLILDFAVVNAEEQTDVLAASVRKDYLSDYFGQLEPYGIDPEVVDIRGVPIVLWIVKQEGATEDGLFMEICRKSATLILFLKKRITLIRTFAFDGIPMEQALPDLQAGHKIDDAVSDRIESSLRSFFEQVLQTIHAFGCQKNEVLRPQKSCLSGMGSLYPGVREIAEQCLRIPAEVINVAGNSGIRMDEGVANQWNPAVMNGALSLAIRNDNKTQGFNFRKDQLSFNKRYAEPKKYVRLFAVYLLIILSISAVALGVDYYRLNRDYKRLDKRIIQVFSKTFPEVKRIVDPVQQMRIKIGELENSSVSLPDTYGEKTLLGLLKEISMRVPGSLNVRITQMIIDPEAVRMSGKADTFNTIDSLKRRLQSSERFATAVISSANMDRSGKGVLFDVKLTRAR